MAEALSSELLLLALLLLTLLLALLLALLILLLLLVLNSSRLGSAKRRSLPSDSTCFIGVSGVVATELIVTDEALDRSFLPALDCCWKNDHQFFIICLWYLTQFNANTVAHHYYKRRGLYVCLFCHQVKKRQTQQKTHQCLYPQQPMTLRPQVPYHGKTYARYYN